MTFKALTTKQKALLNAVQKGKGEGGIYGLAGSLGRNQRRVLDNVHHLEALGYVRVTDKIKNGREITSVTPAVTGSVMTVVNVSLPKEVTANDLVLGLKKDGPLSRAQATAVVSFFAEVPSSLAVKFLKEHDIPLSQAAGAYEAHVKPFQSLSQTEEWLNASTGVERHTP